jgi:hypothetical protein
VSALLLDERPVVAWVLCFDASRPADGTGVVCPLQGELVSIERCLDCHFLVAVADERRADRDCRIEDRIG